jgi:hypothetical protein
MRDPVWAPGGDRAREVAAAAAADYGNPPTVGPPQRLDPAVNP